MKEPSESRKRILALHDRAIRFSNNINQSYPDGSINHPSRVVWDQLVRAGDGVSNNLVEADAASSDADFLNKMRIALREAKESKACLAKIRMGPLANATCIAGLGLEQEADELSAIYATIIMNMAKRLAREKQDRHGRGRRPRN
jgi:four helix bundle protein